MTAFWKEAHDEGGLAWDDTNNNRAFLSQTICATLNGASIYIESLRNPDKYITEKGAQLKTDILHAPLPKGPAGQFAMHTYFSHVHAELLEEPEGGEGLPEVDAHQGELRDVVRLAEGLCDAADRTTGRSTSCGTRTRSWRPSRSPAGSARRPAIRWPSSGKKPAEVLTKYIITDMYAKAVQGMPAEEAVKWAEGELKKIYV